MEKAISHQQSAVSLVLTELKADCYMQSRVKHYQP